jgi:Zn-dependent protease
MTLILIVLITLSLAAGEYARARIADNLGDSTPYETNRLTPNPLRHVDIFGSIILPLIILAITDASIAIGYAKPVAVNPYYFKNPKKGTMLVSLARPLINTATAVISILLMKLTGGTFAGDLFFRYAVISIGLAIFNLMPIPGFDGFKIVTALLPYETAHRHLKTRIIGIIVILVIVLMGLPERFFSFLTGALTGRI